MSSSSEKSSAETISWTCSKRPAAIIDGKCNQNCVKRNPSICRFKKCQFSCFLRTQRLQVGSGRHYSGAPIAGSPPQEGQARSAFVRWGGQRTFRFPERLAMSGKAGDLLDGTIASGLQKLGPSANRFKNIVPGDRADIAAIFCFSHLLVT